MDKVLIILFGYIAILLVRFEPGDPFGLVPGWVLAILREMLKRSASSEME